MLAGASVNAKPCAMNASFGQLSLPALHFALNRWSLQGQLAEDLFSELGHNAIPGFPGEASPRRVAIVSNLVASDDESGMPY